MSCLQKPMFNVYHSDKLLMQIISEFQVLTSMYIPFSNNDRKSKIYAWTIRNEIGKSLQFLVSPSNSLLYHFCFSCSSLKVPSYSKHPNCLEWLAPCHYWRETDEHYCVLLYLDKLGMLCMFFLEHRNFPLLNYQSATNQKWLINICTENSSSMGYEVY